MVESPYVIEQSEGMVHLKLRANLDRCVGCCRTDVYLILRQEIRREAFAEANELIGAVAGKAAGTGGNR